MRKGITLIALVITIIVLLILAGVTVATLTGENGLLGRASNSKEETNKKTAEEKINLKITTAQIKSYAETQTIPTLQYLADELCEDNDMEYVHLKEKEQASLEKITVGETDSILTKLKEYSYEFEIDKDLKLASINGTKIAKNEGTDSWSNKNTWEKLLDIGFTLEEIANNEVILSKALVKSEDVQYMINHTSDIMPKIVNSKNAMKYIGNNKNIYKYIFGDSEENIATNTTWISAILSNNNAIQGLDESNPISVPTMTGYTTPSGEVQAKDEDSSSYAAWKAFNGTTSGNTDAWMGTSHPSWIQYKFDEPVLIYKFYLQNRSYSYATYVNAVYEFSLQGSLNGTSWDDLGEYTNTTYASTGYDTYTVNNITKRYYYYRINVTSGRLSDGTIGAGQSAIGRLQFYGK